MRMISVVETAKKWNISERSVRNYCAQGRVPGAVLNGKVWSIPEDAEKPERSNKKKQYIPTLLDILQEEKAKKYSGGIYHKTQIELTYNSNHMEGSKLTYDQTRYIFEKNKTDQHQTCPVHSGDRSLGSCCNIIHPSCIHMIRPDIFLKQIRLG